MLPGFMHAPIGLEEELVDCSGGDEISLEAGTQRKLEALMQVRCWGGLGLGCKPSLQLRSTALALRAPCHS